MADNRAVFVGADFLLLSTEKDYSSPHIMKVLAIVPKSEAAIWLEQFGNPE
jgi:hypothetical protein